MDIIEPFFIGENLRSCFYERSLLLSLNASTKKEGNPSILLLTLFLCSSL